MTLQVRWTKEAKGQFQEILDYWEKRNGSSIYSNKLLALVDASVSRLSEYPEIGRFTENKRVRLKIIKDYFLYYSYNEETLTVLGVSDMRRDPSYLRSIIAALKTKP